MSVAGSALNSTGGIPGNGCTRPAGNQQHVKAGEGNVCQSRGSLQKNRQNSEGSGSGDVEAMKKACRYVKARKYRQEYKVAPATKGTQTAQT
jgi:hypothetical protein